MKRIFLFDFDGTLVDSMPTYAAVMLRILDEGRITYGDGIIKTITPLGLIGTAKYYRELGLNLTEEEIIDKMRLYLYDAYAHTIEAKPNVIETLRALHARGDDINILTASPHLTLDACLARLGVTELFSNIWSCSDFDTTKSDPEIYKMAAARLGCDVGDVIFIDDNLDADITAKSAGVQTWGIYDDSSAEYIDEMKAVTDRYIYDFSEILK